MNKNEIIKIAEQVSLLLQIKNNEKNISTQPDLESDSLISDYLVNIFKEANQCSDNLAPSDYYRLINERIAQVQAQLYIMRLELDNKRLDPSQVYTDPLTILTDGKAKAEVGVIEREYSFEPSIYSWGWHPVEKFGESGFSRWMRPGKSSDICVPHLGKVSQTIEFFGNVLDASQKVGLKVYVDEVEAELEFDMENSNAFNAKIDLEGEVINSSNFVVVSFHIDKFVSPETNDDRQLGAMVSKIKLTASQLEVDKL